MKTYSIRQDPVRQRKGLKSWGVFEQVSPEFWQGVVFDVTGELGLFQLTWQDFDTSDIRKQNSKAKNFVSQVDDWATRVKTWISKNGLPALMQRLNLGIGALPPVNSVKLFAIGRQRARFGSYGHQLQNQDVAACTWAQFIRMRRETGPASSVLDTIHEKIRSCDMPDTRLVPVPYEFGVGDHRILFEDRYVSLDD